MKRIAPSPPPAQASDPEDPEVQARVERAVAPYKDLLPPEDLALMREMVALYLNTHPDVAPLMDRLRARSPVDASAQVTRPGFHGHAPEATGESHVREREPANPPRKAKPEGR